MAEDELESMLAAMRSRLDAVNHIISESRDRLGDLQDTIERLREMLLVNEALLHEHRDELLRRNARDDNAAGTKNSH
jgi:hypothetical protein